MKTVEEWSNSFDVVVADYINLTSFGHETPLAFDEYEKSVFLTLAQEEIVKRLYNGTLTGLSYEETEAARRQLDTLVKGVSYNDSLRRDSGLHDQFTHSLYELPEDCWFIVYEQVHTSQSEFPCESNKVLDVHPTTHDEYQRIVKNPFRGPNNRRVLRLDFGNLTVELVSALPIQEYTVRYLSKPMPIILTTLEGDTCIEGETDPHTCELSNSIHKEILELAVQLAIQSRVSRKKS